MNIELIKDNDAERSIICINCDYIAFYKTNISVYRDQNTLNIYTITNVFTITSTADEIEHIVNEIRAAKASEECNSDAVRTIELSENAICDVNKI